MNTPAVRASKQTLPEVLEDPGVALRVAVLKEHTRHSLESPLPVHRSFQVSIANSNITEEVEDVREDEEVMISADDTTMMHQSQGTHVCLYQW